MISNLTRIHTVSPRNVRLFRSYLVSNWVNACSMLVKTFSRLSVTQWITSRSTSLTSRLLLNIVRTGHNGQHNFIWLWGWDISSPTLFHRKNLGRTFVSSIIGPVATGRLLRLGYTWGYLGAAFAELEGPRCEDEGSSGFPDRPVVDWVTTFLGG